MAAVLVLEILIMMVCRIFILPVTWYPARLYLNKGDFKFEDITDKAGVGGLGRWARGVSVIDINNDGLMDIYICNTIYKDSLKRRNILYVNQGIDKDGIPHFKDMAAEYGLDIHVQSTMASFFDYDNDGDLTCTLPLMKRPMETILWFLSSETVEAWRRTGVACIAMIWIRP